MRNSKKIDFYLVLLLLSLLNILSVNAQVDKAIGTGDDSNTDWVYPCPLGDMNRGSRMQYLILASELRAAGITTGNLNAIKFTVKDLGMYVNDFTPAERQVDRLSIKIGTTSTASLSNTNWETGTKMVYGPQDHLAVLGVNSFPFSSPFFWNGTDNLVIELCTDGINGSTTANPFVTWTTNLTFNASHTIGGYSDENYCNISTGSNLGSQTTRPNMIFSWTEALPCTSADLKAGNTNASSVYVCAGETFELNLLNASQNSGLTYQWQQSTNNSTWTNIPQATTPITRVSQTASTYYRCVVTCTTGGTANAESVLVSTPNLISGTFTINKNEPASSTNFQSFKSAIDFIKCGINGAVVFNVTSNNTVYNEQLRILNIPGASSTNKITFNGNGNEIAFKATENTARAVIHLDNADHFVFDNLVINATGTGSSEYGYGFFISNDADSNTIRNSIIKTDINAPSNRYGGIIISNNMTAPTSTGAAGCDGNIISNNQIIGGNYGITLVGNTTVANGNTVIEKNRILDFRETAIYVVCSFNTLISENFISRPTRTTNLTNTNAIYIDNINTRLNISGNTMTNFFGGGMPTTTFYGINFATASGLSGMENLISNNLIYNINGGGNVYGIYNNLSHNANFYHNSISLSGLGTGNNASHQAIGFYLSEATGINFVNNNISVTRGGLGTNIPIYCTSSIDDNQINYNNYYFSSSVAASSLGHLSGTNYKTLQEWRNASKQDTKSYFADPMFEDESTGNLKPKNPALDNTGSNIGIAKDILGVDRTIATPDIGAFEFTAPGCTTPVAGKASLTATTICTDEPMTISLTGNSIGGGQIFQLEAATTQNGTFTAVGEPSLTPTIGFMSDGSAYYRVRVTCGGNSVYSDTLYLSVQPAFMAGTYTIDRNAQPSNTNFTSLMAAYNAMNCGISGPVVFNLVANSGTYTEQVKFGRVKGASAVNTITFNGNGNTLKFNSTNSNERAVLKIDGGRHFIINNFVIDATQGTYGFAIQLTNDADNNIIRNSQILSSTTSTSATNFAGIVINASGNDPIGTGDTWSDDNLIENNLIKGGYYGITIAGDPVYFSNFSNFIYNNHVINNRIEDFYNTGIYSIGVEGTIIENNTISRPTRTSVGAFNGIYLSQTNANVTITKNKIFNPFGGNPNATQAFVGFYFDYAGHEKPCIISNNLVYNINGLGAQTGFQVNSGGLFKVYHNTISFDNINVPVSNTATTSGLAVSYAANGIDLKNNIFTITRGGTGLKYGINFVNGDVIPVASDYNNWYIKGTGGNNFIGYRDNAIATLEQWRIITNRDHNSISFNPVYADSATGNYAPTVAPLNDKGTTVGISIDILNQPRNTTTPDMGAYEFQLTPCISGVLAGEAIVNPNSNICIGTNVTLNLKNNTTSGYQTYRWQRAATLTSTWTTISDTLYIPEFISEAVGNAYYRCIVECNGISDTSVVAQLTVNAPLAAGTYSISKTGGDYNSFNAAVSAMSCGIAGPVTFNVANDTYTEQVLFTKIGGASHNARVTFQAASTNAILAFNGTATNNYVIKFDSANFITIKGLTINALNATNARVIEITGTSSYDSISNNTINSAVATATANTRMGIFTSVLKGIGNVINNNNINNGASGIYISSTTLMRNGGIQIKNNTIKTAYQYGIYVGLTDSVEITNNNIELKAPLNTTAYGIYETGARGLYNISSNKIDIASTTTTTYGLFIGGSNATKNNATVHKNIVKATEANTGTLYGIYFSGNENANAINNVVDIKTNHASSYGLYSTNGIDLKVFNNTIRNASASATNNYAAYFTDGFSDRHYSDIKNNILYNEGNGKALFLNNTARFFSNYNLLFTNGNVLAQNTTGNNFANLDEWKAGADLDENSISIKPAISTTDLTPVVADPQVWAINGRGVQISENDSDINNNRRAASLKEGAPDLGAYEFVPTSVPANAVATPATPAANSLQVFKVGTDTVLAVQWGANVPDNITIKRYSGALPTNLQTGTEPMYFYLDADVTGAGNYTYNAKLNYIDPWRGFIDRESRIRLGKTNPANEWTVDAASNVDVSANIISQNNLNFIDKLTGLTNPQISYPSTDSVRTDTTNMGTRFWFGYGHTESDYRINSLVASFGGGAKDAKVTVRINGTSWSRTYNVPAHTFVSAESIPRTGTSGALLLREGWSERGISIESDEPIAAYVKADGQIAETGSTMLIPTSAYGYEYYALAYSQDSYDINVYSWFYVIADHDSTKIEITPIKPTVGGREANKPFTITLNKGEVYQLLGARKSQNGAYDLSGSKIKSLSNDAGNCYPVAVFSGNTRAFVDCSESFVPFGNYLVQQAYPTNIWGSEYVVAPTIVNGDPKTSLKNLYRIMVKDPSTVVKVNGTPLTGITENGFYSYWSNTADHIESTHPVQVAQFIPGSSVTCEINSTGPEMFYAVPLNQGLYNVEYYRTNEYFTGVSARVYVQIVIPTEGLKSLLIDGSNTYSNEYAHPNKPGYSIVIKEYLPNMETGTISSDSMFTAITYGLAGTNSYGFTTGVAFRNITEPGIVNIYDSTGTYSDFNCIGTPFKFSVLLPSEATNIIWKFSNAPQLNPNVDSIQNAPVLLGTVVQNGNTYYKYGVNKEFLFNATGNYVIPIQYTSPVIGNCSSTKQLYLNVKVVESPKVDFTQTYTGCINDVAIFNPTLTTALEDKADKFFWNFGDQTSSRIQTPSKTFNSAGNYTVNLRAITAEGCLATASKQLTVNALPVVTLNNANISVCYGTSATLSIKDPVTNAVYQWYSVATGGTPLFTGTTYTINNVTTAQNFYVSATLNGCVSQPRVPVTVSVYDRVFAPVATVEEVGISSVTFVWQAVQGAGGYNISTDGGTTWTAPSSGVNGLSHTVSGINTVTTIKLLVKALDANNCTDAVSAEVSATTLPGELFFPNAFTPNGDGLNDVFKIEGHSIASLKMVVFNQWGQKIFETADRAIGWDGKHSGKLQPAGVYMYVANIVLIDGTTVHKKGSVNLIR